MTSITLPSITLLYAAAAALLNLWLATRVTMARFATKTMDGHGAEDGLLAKRARAHANFIEYVPLALILMLILELRVGHSAGLWALGAVLIVGRVLHPFGMERAAPNPFRMLGILLTFAALLGLALWAIYLAFQPGPSVTYF